MRFERLVLTGCACASLAPSGYATARSVDGPALQPAEQRAANVAADSRGTLFKRYDAAQLAPSPKSNSCRQMRDANYGKWDDCSDEVGRRAIGEHGNNFDIRGFHDAILSSGPVPLDILEENVDAWMAELKSG